MKRVKKILITLLLLLILLLATHKSNYYTLQGTAYNKGEQLEIVDIVGNIWIWNGATQIQDHTKVVLTMNSLNTDTVYDDEIVSINLLEEQDIRTIDIAMNQFFKKILVTFLQNNALEIKYQITSLISSKSENVLYSLINSIGLDNTQTPQQINTQEPQEEFLHGDFLEQYNIL